MAIELTPFQERLLAVPESFDIFAGGGRSGGKTYGVALLALRHGEIHKQRAKMLYLRRTHQSLQDFASITRDLFFKAYAGAATFNQHSGVWRLPHGGFLELGQLSCRDDYQKYQGRSFSLIVVDEAGQYPSPELIDLMRSNLRGEKGVTPRMVLVANPGGPGHGWLASRYALPSTPWHPFRDEATGRTFVYAPSTLSDNPHIDQDSYRRQLEAACTFDDALLRAWVYGDWAAMRGAFFAGALSEKCAMPAMEPEEVAGHFGRHHSHFDGPFMTKTYTGGLMPGLSLDYGYSAPSVMLLAAKVIDPGTLPPVLAYPRGSILVLDEWTTALSGQVVDGARLEISRQAELVKEFCASWAVQPVVRADDACMARAGHAAGSLADEFAAFGVTLRPAQKGRRVLGWQKLLRMMADAGQRDKPGLYISRRCKYLWETLPSLPADPRRPDDVDTTAADHGADALRYLLTGQDFLPTPRADEVGGRCMTPLMLDFVESLWR